MSQSTIGFRPTDDDRRVLDVIASAGLSTTEAIRRGLHLVAHDLWLDQARTDAEKLRDENVNDAPDAW